MTIRTLRLALLAWFLVPALATAQANLGTYEDRIAVEDVMARYVWTVDSLDADGYVGVFTEDADLYHVMARGPRGPFAAFGCPRRLGHSEQSQQWRVG